METQKTGRPAPGRPPKQWYGELAGVAATALALGLGELVAAATGGPSAPLVAVGGVAVDAAPTPVKEFAVAVFYTYDKLALQAGIVLVLAVFAAFIGVLAMRRLWYGLAGVAVFGMIGVLASATRPSATWAYPLPTVAGALAAAGLLVLLRRTLPRRAAVSAQDRGDDTGPDPHVAAQGTHTPVQGAGSPSSEAGNSVLDGAGQPPGRRRFLALAVGAIGAAAVAVPGGRRLWAQRVAAARAAVGLRLSARWATGLLTAPLVLTDTELARRRTILRSDNRALPARVEDPQRLASLPPTWSALSTGARCHCPSTPGRRPAGA
ncbi:hypothetical protein ACWGH3_06620 [Streptomyces sp. NPDC054884]|uniref:hypothetical protein n=1 Tax=Streptomyces sp. ME08-AFT2 TaxID=3028683 RepID=UPI0029B8A6BE|nr:hypothetical protein [Streptomyces sp. ME08-AFT2]MDX3308563.1 hypothetical protein [Streptomyces sp. ME08-AFT2]